jgi:hypothetical protein
MKQIKEKAIILFITLTFLLLIGGTISIVTTKYAMAYEGDDYKNDPRYYNGIEDNNSAFFAGTIVGASFVYYGNKIYQWLHPTTYRKIKTKSYGRHRKNINVKCLKRQ